MILQALHQLAEADDLLADPDYESKPVAYLVRVTGGGRLLGIESTHTTPPAKEGKKPPKPRPKTFPVAREPGRTSGDRANFLVDKAEYALGLDPETDPSKRRAPEKLALRFGLFRERVKECLEATGDEGVAAVAAFLDQLAAGRLEIELPEGCAGNDLFAYAYDTEERLLVRREAVRRYWKEQRRAAEAERGLELCLVTGELAPPAEKHPQLKFVPGAVSSGVPLVSFNQRAFESYGWSGNENARVSSEAAEAYATALQRLLHPSPPDPARRGAKLARRNLRLGGETVVCYWSPGASDFSDVFASLLEANVDDVRELYRSIWKGRAPEIDDPSAFYALTLSGAQGRVIVRGWFESTVAEVMANLAAFFRDLEVVRNVPKPRERELPPQIPLHVLLQSLATHGKSENVPAPLSEALVSAALRGTHFPLAALQRALLRARAEISRDGWADLERRDARAALIKAVLNRRYRNQPDRQELRPEMDPTNTHPGYLLGRAMAVIERLQTTALGDVNATVVDRYFSAASATPRAVFVRLLKNARHHARKARDNERTRGTAYFLERELDTLLAGFEPKENGFPAHLDLEEQGLFVLGYHQERHWLFTSKADREAARAAAEAENNEAPAGA